MTCFIPCRLIGLEISFTFSFSDISYTSSHGAYYSLQVSRFTRPYVYLHRFCWLYRRCWYSALRSERFSRRIFYSSSAHARFLLASQLGSSYLFYRRIKLILICISLYFQPRMVILILVISCHFQSISPQLSFHISYIFDLRRMNISTT